MLGDYILVEEKESQQASKKKKIKNFFKEMYLQTHIEKGKNICLAINMGLWEHSQREGEQRIHSRDHRWVLLRGLQSRPPS